MRLTVKVALALAALLGVAYLFAFPTRTYLVQRHDIVALEHTISVLAAQNSKLSAEKAALQNDSTIEEIARQEYGLVMPGQQAFMVLPAAIKPVTVPHKAARSAPWYTPLEFWHHL